MVALSHKLIVSLVLLTLRRINHPLLSGTLFWHRVMPGRTATKTHVVWTKTIKNFELPPLKIAGVKGDLLPCLLSHEHCLGPLYGGTLCGTAL
jgi:hypothetical protein